MYVYQTNYYNTYLTVVSQFELANYVINVMSIRVQRNGNGTGTANARESASVVVAAVEVAGNVHRACSDRRRSRTRQCRRCCLRHRIRIRSTGSVRQARRAPAAPGARRARSPSRRRAARWRMRPSRPRVAARARSRRARASTSADVSRDCAMTMPAPACDAARPDDAWTNFVLPLTPI